MQQPTQNQSPQELAGLETLFIKQHQTDASVHGQTDAIETSVTEAAKLLGITERSIWRRISLGKLQARLVNGKTFVSIRQSDVSVTNRTDNEQTSVSVSVDQYDMSINTTNYVQQLLDLIKDKDKELQAASFRNGFLEAQVMSKEEQIKLLPDLQTKANEAEQLQKSLAEKEKELEIIKQTWWYRVWSKVTGKVR